MPDAVIYSYPILMQHVDIAYSWLGSLICWMSGWCSKIHEGFIDNLSSFDSKTGLLRWDGVQHTQEGPVLISCSIAQSQSRLS